MTDIVVDVSLQPPANITLAGVVGAKGDPGTGIAWRGEWSSLSTYAELDAVTADGQSYVAVAASTNVVPDPNATTPWLLFAAKGDTGPQGPTGPTGAQGPAGSGSGDALTTNPLSQFAATTSTQLRGVLTDPSGTGAAVFANSPTLVTPTGIVKGDVGLGNVDNTSDANKPVSTATTTALALKAPLASPTFTGTVTVPTGGVLGTPASITLTNGTGLPESGVTNLVSDLAAKQPLDSDLTTLAGLTATTDNFIVSVSSAWASRTPAQVKATLAIAESDVTNLTSDLALKAPLASPTFTGTVTLPATGTVLGTPASGTLTNCTGLPESGVTNLTTDLAAKQPLDADLTTIAGLTATTDNFIVSVSSAWASRTPAQVRTTLGLVIGTNVQAWDADLDTWAGITPASGVGTFLATPSSANMASMLTDETGTGACVFAGSPTFTGTVTAPTIQGDTASGGSLTLQATSHATKGDIKLDGPTLYLQPTAYTYATASGQYAMIRSDSTVTMNATGGAFAGTGNQFRGLAFTGTVAFSLEGNWVGHQMYRDQTTWKNTASASITNLGAVSGVNISHTITSDTGSFTVTAWTGVSSVLSTSRITSGSPTVTNAYCFTAGLAAVGANTTVTTATGLLVSNGTATGTLTNQIGIDIPALTSGATTNIGIRNLSSLLQKGGLVFTPTTVTVSSNAGTVPVTASNATFTNSSAANMTITLATSGASDGQITVVRVYDASAVTKTIAWVNTENGEGTAPTTSAGSTTLPKTVVFMFNGATSLWRCIIT